MILLLLPVLVFSEQVFLVTATAASDLYIINSKGEEIEGPVRYTGGHILNQRFYTGPTAIVQKKADRRYYVISNEGEWLFSSDKELRPASLNRVWEKASRNVWNLLDFDGNVVFEAKILNNWEINPFENGLSVVSEEKESIVIDEDGKIKTRMKNLAEMAFPGFVPYQNEDYILMSNTIKPWEPGIFWYTFVSLDGKPAFPEMWLSFPGPLSEGLFFARQNNGGNFFDLNGEKIYERNKLRYGSWFSEGLAPVLFGENADEGYYRDFIDHEGNIVISGEELGIYDAVPFSEGLAAVSIKKSELALYSNREWDNTNDKQGLWGAIDHNGNWVIEPQFPSSFLFHRGLGYVCVHYKFTNNYLKEAGKEYNTAGTRTLVIDKTGKIVWDSLEHLQEQVIEGNTLYDMGYEILDTGYPIKE